ncbi:MAG: hypothetical protein LIO37_04340 [Clostridiales bacterium]|nr:hypothetical protein [Clostridiales bacterium]
MSSKTKIIVIRKSQLALALVVSIIILLLAGLIISIIVTRAATNPSHEADTSSQAASAGTLTTANGSATAISASSQALFTPGVYTSTVILNGTAMDVQVIVDADHINSISLVNLDEDVETAYPLVEPAIEDLAQQIISSQSTDSITFSDSSQYTSMVLYGAICDALEKAYVG